MFRIFLYCLCILILSSLNCGKQDKDENKEFTCAVYGFSRDIDFFRKMTPAEIAQTLSEWNIKAVFGGYWDSTLVEALHEEGIKVFAEVGFFIGSEDRWNEFPELRPVNSTGKPILKDDWYYGIVPTVQWFRERKIAILKKTLENYDVDGIWLDFIRWPCHWEVREPRIEQTSFDVVSLTAFQSDTGIYIPNDLLNPEDKAAWILTYHPDEWTRWKCKVITEYVFEIREVVKSYGSEKILGLFGVPWRDSDFDGAIIKVIGQNYHELGKLFDVISPMAYHRMCGKDVGWINDVVSEIYKKGGGKPVWPVIQAMGDPVNNLTASEFRQTMISAIEAEGSEGIIIFTLNSALEEEKRMEMTGIFSSVSSQPKIIR